MDVGLCLFARVHGALLQRERGQTITEYGMIMALVVIAAVVLAVVGFRTQMQASFESASECLSGACGGP
jgi:Flp pilus assembly pilin Flp